MPGRDHAMASQMAAFAAVDQSILKRKIGLPAPRVAPIPLSFKNKANPSVLVDDQLAQDGGHVKAEQEGSEGGSRTETVASEEPKEASVSHVLTNVIIFQSFLLELAALVQVRAAMFNEVRFV